MPVSSWELSFWEPSTKVQIQLRGYELS